MKNYQIKIVSFFSEQKNITLLSSLAATCSAIVASLALLQANRNYQVSLEIGRPYFTIENTQIETFKAENELVISLTTKNIGSRVALDFAGRVVVFTAEQTRAVINFFSSANDIAPNLSPIWRQTLKLATLKGSPHYLVVGVTYADPVTEKKYKQFFYLSWDGLVVSHAGASEKTKFSRLVSGYFKDF